MSLAADALQPQLVRALISASGRAQTRHMADVLIAPLGAGYDLEFDAITNEIRVDFRETSHVGTAICGDAARFAGAAFTSVTLISAALEQPATLAWGLVRLYYAAFYSGHSLLRLLGKSCSYLEPTHITKLRSLASALGTPATFDTPAGLYFWQLNSGQTGFSMSRAGGRVGGAHEVFWEVLDVFLSEATEEVLVGRLTPSDGRAVFQKIEAFRRITRKRTGASWLSAVRNEIQYKHALGVWAPTTVNRTSRGVLSRLATQWERDPMEIDIDSPPAGDLGMFVIAAAFMVALCKAMISRISERSSVGARSFARPLLQLC